MGGLGLLGGEGGGGGPIAVVIAKQHTNAQKSQAERLKTKPNYEEKLFIGNVFFVILIRIRSGKENGLGLCVSAPLVISPH